ncbi:MAG TPA: GIY-YIG nuclease family protein [Candidatus Sulfopaludibacter sp.]|jgi:hypothetical protein|nr:GIY-YIG nuclease family protein [Candidatus Sulfopaludibacter sp.]
MVESRKEAIRKYKERKPLIGAYAIRCMPTGQVWAGVTRNLGAAHNAAWFSLRIDSHTDKSLQAQWNLHGESAFQYEILETLPDDVTPIGLPDLLKEKKAHWLARLNATPLR